MQGGLFRERSHFSSDTGPPRQRKVSFFSAVASWNLLLLDLEEEKVAKKGYKSEKKHAGVTNWKKKRWCLSGKEVPSCDTGPSSAGRGQTHMITLAVTGWNLLLVTKQFRFTTDAFTHRRFYTQTLWHTDTFAHKSLYTQTLAHAQTLSHTNAFTHKHFYTQTLLRTKAFAHKSFYTQTLWHTDTFAHKSFYTQTLLQTNTFTHRRCYTQTLLHTDAFTQRRFYTQDIAICYSFGRLNLISCEMVAIRQREITISLQFLAIEPHFVRKGCAGQLEIAILFWQSNLISCEKVARDNLKSQFYLSFWRSNLISCERVARDNLNSHFYLSFWRSNLISCERVAPAQVKSQFYRSFWQSNLISCERVARDDLDSHFYLSFWRSNLISCERVARDDLNSHFYQFLTIEPHFVRKGCAGHLANRTFTSVFGDRTSFRAKGLRFAPSRWHCPCPRLQKRNRKEGEGKRVQ